MKTEFCHRFSTALEKVGPITFHECTSPAAFRPENEEEKAIPCNYQIGIKTTVGCITFVLKRNASINKIEQEFRKALERAKGYEEVVKRNSQRIFEVQEVAMINPAGKLR